MRTRERMEKHCYQQRAGCVREERSPFPWETSPHKTRRVLRTQAPAHGDPPEILQVSDLLCFLASVKADCPLLPLLANRGCAGPPAWEVGRDGWGRMGPDRLGTTLNGKHWIRPVALSTDVKPSTPLGTTGGWRETYPKACFPPLFSKFLLIIMYFRNEKQSLFF